MAKLGLMLVLVLAAAIPISGLNTRKLDDTSAPGSEKCGTCNPSPPPPSPPPPSPPPPTPCPPPPQPPPTPKKPPCSYCPLPPPPPPSSYIYITGPPGGLYPIDESFNGAGRSSTTGMLLLVGLGMLGLLALW